MTTKRGRDLPAVPVALDIKMEADVGRGEERERLVEQRHVRRCAPQLVQGQWLDPAANGAVADLEQIVGMGDHEGAVVEIEDVELDEVDAQLDGLTEGRKRVLGSDRRAPTVGDPQHAPRGRPVERGQILRMTTTAQSSVRSPPVKARQSSTTARASSFAGSPAFA